MRKVRFERPHGDRWFADPAADVVEVYVDGRPIDGLLERSGHGGVAMPAEWVLKPGHRVWLGEPASRPDVCVDGRVMVLRCADGLTDCGGVSMKVEVADRTIEWSDFRANPTGEDLGVAPMRFERRPFEKALEQVRWQGL